MKTHPRLRIRKSNMSSKWYVVIQKSKYDSVLVTTGLTWKQSMRLCIDIMNIAKAVAA